MSLAATTSALADRVETLGVLFEDSVGGPPTADMAAGYNESLDAFEFVADVEQLTLEFFPGGGLPQIMVVDTATMTIVYKATGYDEGAVLEAVAGI